MKNIHAMAGGSVGYVCGVLSSRQRGVAFPLDLVRSVARVAARLAVRRRVAREFGGYLVTDEASFSGRRWRHEHLPVHCTGDFFRDYDFVPWARRDGRGALDAPPWIAAGSVVPLCVLSSGAVLARAAVIERGALQ